MKKIYSIFIIFGILILISNTAFAINYNSEHKKIEAACKLALDSYMQTFMTEETPEEDKIKNYSYSYYTSNERKNDYKLYVNIDFHVTPENKENTTWNKGISYCFASFSKVDGEYVLDKISRYPDYYDEFLERFEEYKKDNPTTIENKQIQGEEVTNNLINQEIEKMSYIIFGGCSIALVAMVSFIIIKFIKNRK